VVWQPRPAANYGNVRAAGGTGRWGAGGVVRPICSIYCCVPCKLQQQLRAVPQRLVLSRHVSQSMCIDM
jgi:hypothetical protein